MKWAQQVKILYPACVLHVILMEIGQEFPLSFFPRQNRISLF